MTFLGRSLNRVCFKPMLIGPTPKTWYFCSEPFEGFLEVLCVLGLSWGLSWRSAPSYNYMGALVALPCPPWDLIWKRLGKPRYAKQPSFPKPLGRLLLSTLSTLLEALCGELLHCLDIVSKDLNNITRRYEHPLAMRKSYLGAKHACNIRSEFEALRTN